MEAKCISDSNNIVSWKVRPGVEAQPGDFMMLGEDGFVAPYVDDINTIQYFMGIATPRPTKGGQLLLATSGIWEFPLKGGEFPELYDVVAMPNEGGSVGWKDEDNLYSDYENWSIGVFLSEVILEGKALVSVKASHMAELAYSKAIIKHSGR